MESLRGKLSEPRCLPMIISQLATQASSFPSTLFVTFLPAGRQVGDKK